VEERSALQTLNSQFQHKLAEYFKKKKVNAIWCGNSYSLNYRTPFLFSFVKYKTLSFFSQTDDRQQEIEKNVSDQEQRYIKYLGNGSLNIRPCFSFLKCGSDFMRVLKLNNLQQHSI
jgi:hypothetical protein